ncbi:tRNA (adenosine(37)-N6)-threonylcarbamoyltransferase complex ATPase subunit type 1 TsaE [Parasphingorhabdus flavimaris]|jgi:tRNA threonylcarbamoyladenosine biosynthesis protein TsaE|uniref:tRNA threonylcarbamoyladenosine biosynthesis protein TsaE n=1 Tax=Parasphingorhabdus flavimaris TaxID=266812 RepID=A0ABX2N1K7_9SPHN|nr:tRNA (adenosine(37)-N6)-threonylcarbamoyltransferase complex ATPase subunit type 1 TsaE [Parasphingorhabdus flavimaris]NVD27561.1 tRNA (adenosine(37)-N6)-threonylcarbamoyltransferase complex ATPase subunit type 1 TsaE [Parasphingorhabdus flavimaris]|tara:strand:- start:5468 stop:5914 length:447 start_codon:yes stop_codon:yes gene_type:complete
MLLLKDEQATLDAGRQLGALLRQGDKLALSGTLGAGKTTFARGILEGLGYGEEVPSPTFAIVQQYELPETRIPVAHVDLYRIDDPDEIFELGLDDILDVGAMIVEWPDRMPDSFWRDALRIELEITGDDNRRLTWTAGSAWKDRWPLT